MDAKANPGGGSSPAAATTAARDADRAPLPGLLLMAMVALAWGLHWPISKLAFAQIPPLSFRTFGIVIAGIVLLAICRLQGRARGIPKGERGALVISALLNITLFQATVAYGLYLMQASQAIIIGYSYPVWVVILGRVLFGERITVPRLAALFFGWAALVMLFWPAGGSFDLPLMGTIVMVLNSLGWAAGTFYYKSRRWTLSTMEIVGWQMAIGSVPLVVGALMIESLPDPSDLSTNVVLAALYSFFIAQTLGHFAWFRALVYLSPVIAALISLANPVVGVFASVWIMGEPLTWRKLVALVFIIISLFIVVVGPAGMRALGVRK